MCGLVGYISWKSSIDPQILHDGADAITHRGPDGYGHWVSENKRIGLGHRRLSIIDLETGTQPISNETHNIHIIVNGEFYDHTHIRQKLEQKGHIFRTQSDSEIALHLYEEHGIDFVNYLRGEFSFILWDERQQTLIAGRDRFGVKPLCFTKTDHGVFIASEAKALFAMGNRVGIKAEWDEASFFHATNVQYTQPDRTLFKNIHQLEPAHILIAKNGVLNMSKYWDMDYPIDDNIDNPTTENETELIEKFHDLFSQSVSVRLRSDVPLCFHLSGGLDSASVLAMAAKHSDKPLHAFTVAFDHDGYNELPIAKEMAQHCEAELHVVHVNQDDLIHELPNAVYHGEGLAINGHLSAKYLLNKAIQNAGFKVALTGEGADEVLAGYPHLRHDLFATSTQPNADSLLKELYQTNSASTGVQLAHGTELDTSAIQNALGFVPSFLSAKASLGYRIQNILSTDFKARFTETDCYKNLIEHMNVTEQLTGRHNVHQSLYLWSKLALANYILRTLGDGMEMSHSIEGRLPFLDHKLFQFLRSLPMSLKIKGTTEKYILREAMKPYITNTVYNRQKHPFMAPPVSLFSNPRLNQFIQDTIRSSSFKTIPFFDIKSVLTILDDLENMKDSDRIAMEPMLMTLLTTALLHQKFNL